VIAGFRKGVHGVLPGARVRVDYAGETSNLEPCETIANRQIDAGAEVLLVVAGRCGMGAAAVVHARGAWLAGEDEYGVSDHQPWVVASLFKDWDDATRRVVQSFVAGTLPAGDDLVLGLHDLYATGMTMSDAVPSDVQSQVIELCTRIRQQAARAAAA
jgi:basic membrane lipoprotein Med (substrate-binding protein (PBP1-ABC) superfamily)